MNSACADKSIEIVSELIRPDPIEVAKPPVPLSITHRHILSCINSWIAENKSGSGAIRILDVGCGDGVLVRYLAEALKWSHGPLPIEIYGMDVHDHGVQSTGYFDQTLSYLLQAVPSVDWKSRLRLVSVSDPWPFPDKFFDTVVSNQVLEHVGNHNYFFSQHKRVMKDDGAGFHLFPLWHCLLEPHLRMPLVHWISNRERRARAIMRAAKLGFGKFKGHPSELEDYAIKHADYLTEQVNYKTQRQIATSAKETGLIPSFSKSHHYYLQKLRTLAGRPVSEQYNMENSRLGQILAILLRYVSSSTLELRVPEMVHDSKYSPR